MARREVTKLTNDRDRRMHRGERPFRTTTRDRRLEDWAAADANNGATGG